MRSSNIKLGMQNITLSTVGHFITDMYPAFIIGIIPLIALKFELSLFEIAAMTSIAQISNSLTQPIFGYLADKKSFKYFMAYGLLAAAVFLSLIAIAPSYYFILIFIFAGSLGVSAFHPPSAAMGAQYNGKSKAFGNSIISFGGCAGYAVGTFFFILIVEKFGIKFSPLAMIPGIVFFFLLLRFMPDSNFKKNFSLKNQEKENNVIAPGILKKEKLHVKTRKEKIILLIFIWFSSYTRDVLWIGIMTFMPVYFTQAKISILNTSALIMIFTFTIGHHYIIE